MTLTLWVPALAVSDGPRSLDGPYCSVQVWSRWLLRRGVEGQSGPVADQNLWQELIGNEDWGSNGLDKNDTENCSEFLRFGCAGHVVLLG